jgi:hypothetical protein
MRISFVQKLCALCATTAVMLCSPQLCAQAAASGVPDVAGIRPGMTAQQAYDALKAHAPRAKIAIGQNTVEGVSATPVPDLMTVKIDDRVPSEILTIWLTTPPSKQVVWAVAQSMTYPESNKMLVSTVVDALRKRFGNQTGSQPLFAYWAFDQQGRHADATASNCINSQNFSIYVVDPTAPTFTYVTPLIYPMSPKSQCDELMDVKAQLTGPNNAAEYVTVITVTEVDHSLVRSTKEAYSAYMANAGAHQQQQELQKAKEQKAPVF